MRVRGSLSITKDLTLPNPGGTTPSKGLVALSDAEGNLQWGNLLILPLDLNLTYPDKGALVTHNGAVYFSLVNKASGSSYSNPYIWKRLIGSDALTQEQRDAINLANSPSITNPFVTLGDLQSNFSELRMVGDVTGYSQFEDGVLVIYTTLVDPVLEGAQFVRDSFDYIGAQSFMLSTDVVRIFIITVNGQVIDESQYSITDLRQLNILDELDPEDHIIATYNLKAALGSSTGTSTNVTVNYITPVDGNIAITPANIGLGNVNNTSDINKPISNAAQQAINVLRLEGNFEHIQTELAYNWLIRHGMQKYPSVTVIGIDGAEYEGEVRHIDKNNLAILFSAPLRGTATFN